MWIIDRIEGEFAVIECGELIFNVPLAVLPKAVNEGDVIEINISREKRNERENSVNSLMNKLFGDKK